MIATIQSATLLGITGHTVSVEVHVGNGLPGYHMVGLPDTACRESRDRVRAAILSTGLRWPDTRITVNLAPAGIRKAGAGLDVAIAVGVLVATEQLDAALVDELAFVGELGLDGSLRPVAGVAPLVAAMRRPAVVVPVLSWQEACAVATSDVRLAGSLAELLASLQAGTWPHTPGLAVDDAVAQADLADVRGQPEARASLEIAAAGGHHLLLVGPPGSGKTMIAQRLVGLLPSLDPATALEATMAHSAAGAALPASGVVRRPTFRAPQPLELDGVTRRRWVAQPAPGRDLARARWGPVPRRAR
jgi:magnesium chelatase family protein